MKKKIYAQKKNQEKVLLVLILRDAIISADVQCS